MKTLLVSILVSAVAVLGFQIVVPFPYGLILGITIAVIIIWCTMKTKSANQFSLSADKQNKEAFRTLKKRFLDGEITKEEFDRLREPLGNKKKTKSRYKIIGALALAFGIINIFWYAPYSFALVFMNQPFPFSHLQNVELRHGGIGTQVSYLPFENAISDPYWLAWSLSLYSGIAILSALGIKSIVQNT